MTEPSECWRGLPSQPADFESRLRACGAQGTAIAGFDWSTTPLGAISAWPVSLKAVVHTLAASGQPMCLWYGPEMTTIFNAGFAPILGARAATALGRRLDEVWPEVYGEILPMVRQALSGQTVWEENLPLWMTRNGFEELTYWTFSYSPVLDDDGRIAGFLDVVTETTEAVKSRSAIIRTNESLAFEVENAARALADRDRVEREQIILKRELVHRMKNMLAVISAMVNHSIRNARDLADAADTTAARLAAYARVQEVFSENAWSDADLRQVVMAAIAPHLGDAQDRLRLEGPDLQVSARHALAVALGIHELATNAVKHGALSGEAGRVDIRWSEHDGGFTFEWQEQGGPPVREPERYGFGSTLTDRIVPAYFSGHATRRFAPEGLHYILVGRVTPTA